MAKIRHGKKKKNRAIKYRMFNLKGDRILI
jgi:hypothetical protein